MKTKFVLKHTQKITSEAYIIESKDTGEQYYARRAQDFLGWELQQIFPDEEVTIISCPIKISYELEIEGLDD